MSLVNRLFPSRYLRADALPKSRQACTITRCDETEFRGDDGKIQLRLCLPLEEFEAGLICNKTNAATLERALGSNIAKWAGKKVLVKKEVASFAGKIVDAIRLEVLDEAPAAPSAA